MDDRLSTDDLDHSLITWADVERLDRVPLRARKPSRSMRRYRDAERQRRRWDRLRRGEIIAPVPVDAQGLDALIALRWLAEQDAADRGKVGDAIGRMLADLAQHR